MNISGRGHHSHLLHGSRVSFKEDESVDFDALGKLIDYIIGNGIEYIVSLGTTGETPILDKQEKLDILNYTFEKVNGRVPVVVGIGGHRRYFMVVEALFADTDDSYRQAKGDCCYRGWSERTGRYR